jgi:FMNH2-dependent dimethyl sulfone monooxygenase
MVGTKEQIVDALTALWRDGLDGVLISFPRYEAGMREFRNVTYPPAREAELRDMMSAQCDRRVGVA